MFRLILLHKKAFGISVIRPTAAERGRFRAEVCFIGSLYQNKRSADEYQLPPYYRGYFEGMLRAQLQICSDRFLDEL